MLFPYERGEPADEIRVASTSVSQLITIEFPRRAVSAEAAAIRPRRAEDAGRESYKSRDTIIDADDSRVGFSACNDGATSSLN